MVSGAIQQFLSDVAWGMLDYLVVDLPPGTGDAQLTLAQAIPLTGAVIVTTPQDVALQIAAKALAMFQQLRVPILGIVENMSGFVCPHCGTPAALFRQGGGRRASERLGVPFLGAVPLDASVCQAGDRGEPMVARQATSATGAAFRAVADAVVRQVEAAGTGPTIRFGQE
jgi:ATP-binding protein involved in chromosome partitioning